MAQRHRSFASLVLFKSRHDLNEVAGPVTIIQLPLQDVVPAVLTRSWAAWQREEIAPARHTRGRAALHSTRSDFAKADHRKQRAKGVDLFFVTSSA